MKNLFVILMLVASSVEAQTYPLKPVRFIVGFPPGGSADPTTRIMGQALSEQFGQPFLTENWPGADRAIAAEQVSKLPEKIATCGTCAWSRRGFCSSRS